MTATQREQGLARRLLGFGVDRDLAERLAAQATSLKKLRALPPAELKRIGLNNFQVDWLKDTVRPPIPPPVVAKVLNDSAWTCCVFRDSSRSVILHHIDEWEHSHSHEPSNLAALCLQHHDEAHTKRALSLNLTPPDFVRRRHRGKPRSRERAARPSSRQ